MFTKTKQIPQILIIFFVICIIIYLFLNGNSNMTINVSKNIKPIEKYMNLDSSDRDSDFYLSPIRVRDYQDIISITESQLIETV